jgi:hypothetical protein
MKSSTEVHFMMASVKQSCPSAEARTDGCKPKADLTPRAKPNYIRRTYREMQDPARMRIFMVLPEPFAGSVQSFSPAARKSLLAVFSRQKRKSENGNHRDVGSKSGRRVPMPTAQPMEYRALISHRALNRQLPSGSLQRKASMPKGPK